MLKIRYRLGISLIALLLTIITILILVSAVVIMVGSNMDSSRLSRFVDEISQIQDAVDSQYIMNNSIPTSSEKLSVDEVTDLIESRYRTDFEEEINLNSDNTSEFYKVDLNLIEIDNLNLADNNSREYIVSYPNLNVYSLKPIKIDDVVYFSITSKLDNIVEYNNSKTNSTSNIITENGVSLKVDSNTSTYSNELGINVKIDNLENIDFDIYLEFRNKDSNLLKIKVNNTYNSGFAFDSLEDLNNNSIVENGISSDVIEQFNSSNEKYINIILEEGNKEIARQELNVSNYDIINPSLEIVENNLLDNMKTLKLSTVDNESGVKEIRYDYLKRINSDGSINNYYDGISNFDVNYMMEKSKVLSISELVDGNAMLKIPKDVYTTYVATVDNAGNISTIQVYSEDVVCSITPSVSSPTKASSITYTFKFSQDVVGFDKSDIQVVNGTASTFTKIDNSTYTLVVNSLSNKKVTQKITVPQGVCTDIEGISSNLESSVEVVVDTTVDIVKVTSVSLNKTSITLAKDSSEKLVATVLPSNATNKAVSWSSDDPDIATVDSNGLVTAKAIGSTTITVTSQDDPTKKAICTVNVVDSIELEASIASVTSSTISVKINATANIGNITNIKVQRRKNGDTTTTTRTINVNNTTYNSTYNISGLTGNSTYQITVIATCSDGSTKQVVLSATTTEIKVTSVSLNKTSMTLVEGNAGETLVATVLPSNATNKNVNWSSSSSIIATVDSNGLVTPKSAGTAIITVTSQADTSKKATCTVVVKEAVARIGTTYYSSVQDAFNASSSSSSTYTSIYLLENFTVTSTQTLANGKYVNLYTQGYTINCNTASQYVIKNNGNLNIYETGTIQNSAYRTIYNDGILNVSNTTIKSTYSGGCGVYNNSGTITINSGTISGNTGIETTTGTIYVKGGNITGTSDKGIYATGVSTINVNGGTITGYKDGILCSNTSLSQVTMSAGNAVSQHNTGISSEGKVNITGGNITGIYSSTTGIVTLGADDGNVSTTSPKITQKLDDGYGVYLSGSAKFNYYDGVISGESTAISRYSNITTPTGYEIIRETENGVETVTLGEPVASIGDRYYTSIQDAFAASSTSSNNASTIELLDTVTITSTATFPETHYAKLNMNGHTIKRTNGSYTITNKGTLTISETGTISNTYHAIYNQGTLTIDGPTIASTSTSQRYYGIINMKEVNVNSGVVKGPLGGITNGTSDASSTSDQVINITGGEITNTSNSTTSIYVRKGQSTISGGTIEGGTGVYVYTGTLKVTDGKIIGNKYKGINVTSSGTLELGTSDTATPKLVPEITGKENGVSVASTATFNYYDGTIIGDVSDGAISGEISKKPSSYYPLSEFTDTQEKITLGIAEAYIGSTNSKYFGLLEDAIEASKTGETIYFAKNITKTSTITIGETKNIIINTNVYNLTSSASYALKNQGTLKIIGSGIISGLSGVSNVGTLDISSITIKANSSTGISNTGELTVNSGKVQGGTYGIYNGSTTSISNIKGGEVTGNRGIYSSSTGVKVNITGGTVTGKTNDGVYISNGILTMTGGKVETLTNSGISSGQGVNTQIVITGGEVTGIYCVGTLTLGSDDGNVSTTSPLITGKLDGTMGVNLGSDATFNFYDGKIVSNSGGKSIVGTVSSVPDGYYVYTSVSSNIETAILKLDIEAYIGSTNSKYYTKLEDAIEASKTGEVVYFAKDITKTATVTIGESKNITINTNGYDLTSSASSALKNQGTLEILGSGTISGSSGVSNVGTLELSSVTIKANSSTGISNTGELTVNSGKVQGGTYGIYNGSTTSISNIKGGEVTGNRGIYSSSTGVKVNITGGTVTGKTNDGVYISNGILTMTGGKVETLTNSGISSGQGVNTQIVITGGEVTGIYCVGTLTLGSDDGNVSTTSPLITGKLDGTMGVNLGSDATFNFYDGKIVSNSGGEAIVGSVSKTPDGYEVNKYEENGKQVATLRAGIAYFKLEPDEGTAILTNQVYNDFVIYSSERFYKYSSDGEVWMGVDLYPIDKDGNKIELAEGEEIQLNQFNLYMHLYSGFKGTGKDDDVLRGEYEYYISNSGYIDNLYYTYTFTTDTQNGGTVAKINESNIDHTFYTYIDSTGDIRLYGYGYASGSSGDNNDSLAIGFGLDSVTYNGVKYNIKK